MALEDFTTYTEVDPNGDFTVAANSIVVDTMRRDANSYVYKDFTAGEFTDFTHELKLTYSAQTDTWAAGIAWGLTAAGHYTSEDMDGTNEGVSLYLANKVVYIVDHESGVSDGITYGAIPVTRYIKIIRSGSLLSAYIFTDAAMTSLEDTLSVACTTDAFSTVVAVSSREEGTNPSHSITFTVENLDLNMEPEAAVSVGGGSMGIGKTEPEPAYGRGARKPYLNLKHSMREFFSAKVRYLKEFNMKESVFEKPYLDSEYPFMHLDLPYPDWPSWNFDDSVRRRRGSWPKPNGGKVPPNCTGCILHVDGGSASVDCTKFPVDVHAAIYCTYSPPRGDDVRIKAWAQLGRIASLESGSPSSGGPGVSVYVDPDVSYHLICAVMQDGEGYICSACADVNCACSCTDAPAFSIDESATPATITAGSYVDVFVLGGCPPFHWLASGAGHYFGKPYTDVRYNRLYSNNLNCGSVAGYTAPLVTVTVIDACNTTDTMQIRNSKGTWEFICGGNVDSGCTAGPPSCNCVVNPADTYVYHSKIGTGGAYNGRWTIDYRTSCDAGCSASVSSFNCGIGVGCGGDTVTRTEAGVATGPAACWDSANLYLWTCGADC